MHALFTVSEYRRCYDHEKRSKLRKMVVLIELDPPGNDVCWGTKLDYLGGCCQCKLDVKCFSIIMKIIAASVIGYVGRYVCCSLSAVFSWHV